MFFDKLFLRVSLALFFSMFCASEMQAVPSGKDSPTLNTSKRKVSESRRPSQGYPGNSSEALSATGTFIALEAIPAEEKHGNKRQNTISEEDAALFAAVDAAEEEYYRSQQRPTGHQNLSLFNPFAPSIGGTEEVESQMEIEFWQTVIATTDVAVEDYSQSQQSQTPLASPSSSQNCTPPEQASFMPSSRTQGADVNPYNQTPEEDAAFLAAVIATEERHSQGQASQTSSSPIAYGQESYVPQSPPTEGEAYTDQEEHVEGFRYYHLTTPQDHQQYLIDAINSAQQSILITSYTLSADVTSRSDLFRAMQSASNRGVHIHLYANESRLGDRQSDGLERLRNLWLYKDLHQPLAFLMKA